MAFIMLAKQRGAPKRPSLMVNARELTHTGSPLENQSQAVLNFATVISD